jgi:hypothetical protein
MTSERVFGHHNLSTDTTADTSPTVVPSLERHYGRHFSDCCSVTRTTLRQPTVVPSLERHYGRHFADWLFRHSNDNMADTLPTVVPPLVRHHGGHVADGCCVTRPTPWQTRCRRLLRHSTDTMADTLRAPRGRCVIQLADSVRRNRRLRVRSLYNPTDNGHARACSVVRVGRMQGGVCAILSAYRAGAAPQRSRLRTRKVNAPTCARAGAAQPLPPHVAATLLPGVPSQVPSLHNAVRAGASVHEALKTSRL